MNTRDLQHLQCPYCAHSFRVGTVWKEQKKEWQYASVVCACDEFPVVEGILFLHKPQHREVLDYLRQRNFIAALLVCLTQRRKLHPSRIWMKVFGLRIAQKVLDRNFLKKIGERGVVQVTSLFTPAHLLKYYFTRGSWQDSLALAFPMAIFSETLKSKKESVLWLDVGSGIFNFFEEIQRSFPKLKIISLEYDFFNLFISSIFYPGKEVVKICGNGHFPQVTQAGRLDVVSYIDALQCHVAPIPIIKQLSEPGWLKKNAVVFFSGLPEHLYLHRDWGIFPVPMTSIAQAFPTSPLVLDNELLCQKIREGSVTLKKVLFKKTASKQSPTFRYSLLWSKKNSYPQVISTEFLAQSLRKKATQIWSDHPIIWKNEAY